MEHDTLEKQEPAALRTELFFYHPVKLTNMSAYERIRSFLKVFCPFNITQLRGCGGDALYSTFRDAIWQR